MQMKEAGIGTLIHTIQICEPTRARTIIKYISNNKSVKIIWLNAECAKPGIKICEICLTVC